MLQRYIAILSGESSTLPSITVALHLLNLAVNAVVLFAEDQPAPRQFAILCHVLGQFAMRTLSIVWIAVHQAERSFPLVLAYVLIALMCSNYIYRAYGNVVSTVFALPLALIAWDTTRTQDIFGWKSAGPMVRPSCSCQ